MTARFLLLAFAVLALLGASQAAASGPATVEVAFVRGDRLVRVERVVPAGDRPEVHALKELVQGPTPAERAQGLRTALREGVHVRSLRVVGDAWLARFSRKLLAPATARTMKTRLAQISATLAGVGPAEYAAIAAEGRLVTTLRIGMRPADWRPLEGEKGYTYALRGVQLRLALLGFLDRSSVTGTLDYATEQALLAFQAGRASPAPGR